jgi:hypothetical protein
LFEFSLRTSIVGISIGVKLSSLLAKRTFDFSISSILANAKHSVWVRLRHYTGYRSPSSSILAELYLLTLVDFQKFITADAVIFEGQLG